MLTDDDGHKFDHNPATIVKVYSNARIDDLYRIVITEPQPDSSYPHLDRVKIDLNAEQMRELIWQMADVLRRTGQVQPHRESVEEEMAVAHAY